MTLASVAALLALFFLLRGTGPHGGAGALERLALLEGENREGESDSPGPAAWLLRLPYRLSPPAVRGRLASGLEAPGIAEGALATLAGGRAWMALAAGALGALAIGSSPAWLALASPAAACGLLLPAIVTARRRARNLREVRKDLPQAADLLYAHVLGGKNLDQAFRSAAGAAPGPLGLLMRQAVREMELGATREAAFLRVTAVCPLPELSSLLRSIVEAERRGHPVSVTLGVFSAEIRLRRRDEVRAEVARAPLKMLAPLVFLILPASVLLTVGPTVLVTLDRFF